MIQKRRCVWGVTNAHTVIVSFGAVCSTSLNSGIA